MRMNDKTIQLILVTSTRYGVRRLGWLRICFAMSFLTHIIKAVLYGKPIVLLFAYNML